MKMRVVVGHFGEAHCPYKRSFNFAFNAFLPSVCSHASQIPGISVLDGLFSFPHREASLPIAPTSLRFEEWQKGQETYQPEVPCSGRLNQCKNPHWDKAFV